MGLSSSAERGDLGGLWNNPASLAGLSNAWSFLFGVHSQFDQTLFACGISKRAGFWTFGAGVEGLAYGTVIGDVAYFGDAGRTLETTSLLFTETLSLSLGKWARLPFAWDLGLSLKQAHESLDGSARGLLLADVGMIVAFRPAAPLELRGGLRAAQLAIDLRPNAAPDAPTRVAMGLAATWSPLAFLSMALQVQEEWSSGDEWRTSVGMEWVMARAFILRAGVSSGATTRFTLGAGFQIALPMAGSAGVDLSGIPGAMQAESMGTLRAGFGKGDFL